MLHGYARVFSAEQNPDAQRDALTRAGVHLDWLYLDRTSGAKSSRPVWDALCKALHSRDVLFGLAVTVPVGGAESTTQRDTVNQLVQS